jgi:hypothetical protein
MLNTLRHRVSKSDYAMDCKKCIWASIVFCFGVLLNTGILAKTASFEPPNEDLIAGTALVETGSLVSETPALSITRTEGSVTVSWPVSASDWLLEEALVLGQPIGWARVPLQLYRTNLTYTYVSSMITNGSRLYRLRRIRLVDGLSGQWRFDEGQGQAAQNESLSGAEMLLTNVAWAAGRVGPAAVHFNGQSASAGGSWGVLNNTGYRVLPQSGRPFTVSMWFNPDAVTVGTCGLIGNDASGSDGWHVALHTPYPGTNYLIFAATGVNASLSVTGRTLLLPRQWHELTATYDGTQGCLYVDGALMGCGPGALMTHDGAIYLGGRVGGYESFLGSIDNLRTYTNALTEEQVSLSGYWRFDENADSFVSDAGVAGNHGRTLDAAVWAIGKSGLGIELDKGQVIIPNYDFNVLPPTGAPFSLSFWLRPQSWSTERRRVMACAEAGKGWEIAIERELSGRTWFCFDSTNTGGTLNLRAPVALTSEVWTKINLTYNGGTAVLYVDGLKVGEDSGGIQGTRSPLIIGEAQGGTGFDGVIDDLKVYRRERDASEIGPVAQVMWESVFVNGATNLFLQGQGPSGKTLSYAVISTIVPTNGSLTHEPGSPVVTYHAGARKGPDAFTYTVSDGEFTSPPTTVALSVVQPHWVSTHGGAIQPLDGSSPGRAWPAGTAAALDAIWKTNNYYDCFFYAPGTYLTTGSKSGERPSAYPGCKHIGSGSVGGSQTTLKLVDILGAWTEESIFAYYGGLSHGFEVHNMALDCNATNTPKFIRGQPVLLKIPLVKTVRVQSVTLRWSFQGAPLGVWRAGSASDFKVLSRMPLTGAYDTNVVGRSTGQVDMVTVEAVTDELLIELDRRAPGIDFYSLAEVEVSGAAISLPSAIIPGGIASRLYPESQAYSILNAVDDDPGTVWASGSESEVQVLLPLPSGTHLSEIHLDWNCRTLPEGINLGPAADYIIQAMDPNTRLWHDVPFVRHARATNGLEVVTFGTAESTNTIIADQIMILLFGKEFGVDSYSLRGMKMLNGSVPVAFRVPSADSTLTWPGLNYSLFNAYDGDFETQWSSGTQGMIGAIDVLGNNMKFTGLKVIGFGTKAARECFALYVFNPFRDPPYFGNVLVEDCIFEEPAHNNADGISVLVVVGNGGSVTNTVVRRCTIRGIDPHFSVSNGARANFVENSLIQDCNMGIYFEPDSRIADDYGAVLIRSNQFLNVSSAVNLVMYPGSRFGSMTCVANDMVLNGRGGWGFGACDTCFPGPGGAIKSITAINNIIRYVDWSPKPTKVDGAILYSDIENAVFGNNVIAIGTGNELRVRHCPSGFIPPSDPPQRCGQPQEPPPPGGPTYPPCLNILPSTYRRTWFNNRDLSGTLLHVKFSNWGVNGLAAQQQWP